MSERTEAEYRRVFEQAPGLFLLVRPDPDFTIVDASDAYLQATFNVREEIVGRGLFDVLPKEPAATRAAANIKLRRSFDKVVATGRRDAMQVQRFDVRRPDEQGGGSVERFWSAVNSPIRADDGQLRYIVHSIEDVTEFVLSSRAMQNDDDTLRLEILNRGRQLAAANRQLHEVVSQFQAIYDQGLFAGRIDLDGTLSDANRLSLEQCGYTREEVIGKPFWECGWWNRSADVQNWVRHAIERAVEGENFRGVSSYFLHDGTERVVDFQCMPIKDELGNVQFVFSMGTDITERVAGERNLRAAEIVESITEGFFAVDREWRFTYVNRAAQDILGRASNTLIGNALWDEFAGLHGTPFEPVLRRAMEERAASGPVTAYYPQDRRWYEVQAYPAVEGITVYFHDVTAHVETEAERERLAAESERQQRIYGAALSSTPDLIYVVDDEQRIMYANEALLGTLGKTREEAAGRTCAELGYPPGHVESHAREIELVVAKRVPVRSEVELDVGEGRRVYDWILVPVAGADGDVVAVVGSARDITDRQAAERAVREHANALREADRAKDEFLATLAHELRNPLAPLSNAVHLLNATVANDTAKSSLVALMERQLNHLIRLVDDLLELSRISRGALTLAKETVALADVVRSAVETSQPLIEAARHRFTVSIPEEPMWLEGDPVRLAQIVANLLNNAARYTENGGQVSLRAEREGDAAVISVCDTGIGIDAEVLPHVFDMFSRGADRAAHGGGLGIGLALARRLASMHGGSVEAHSAGTGKGSKFVVRLPLATAPKALAVERGAPGDKAGERPGRLRILVVDDNRDAATTLAMILESFGAQARVARSGLEALETVKVWAPRIVFLDIGMPVMDGYEVARRVRKDDPHKQVTLIALTGWGQREDRRKAREAGFDHHIVKPADIGALRALVDAEIDRAAIAKDSAGGRSRRSTSS